MIAKRKCLIKAHDGDEVLITLNVNTLTQKPELNNNIQSNSPSFQNNLFVVFIFLYRKKNTLR